MASVSVCINLCISYSNSLGNSQSLYITRLRFVNDSKRIPGVQRRFFADKKKNNGKSGPLKNEPSGGQRQLNGENKGSNRNEEVRMIAKTRSCIFGWRRPCLSSRMYKQTLTWYNTPKSPARQSTSTSC